MSASPKLLPHLNSSANVAQLELEYLETFGTYTRLHYENRSCTNLEQLLHAARLTRVLRDRGVLPWRHASAMLRKELPRLSTAWCWARPMCRPWRTFLLSWNLQRQSRPQ